MAVLYFVVQVTTMQRNLFAMTLNLILLAQDHFEYLPNFFLHLRCPPFSQNIDELNFSPFIFFVVLVPRRGLIIFRHDIFTSCDLRGRRKHSK